MGSIQKVKEQTERDRTPPTKEEDSKVAACFADTHFTMFMMDTAYSKVAFKFVPPVITILSTIYNLSVSM